MRVVDGTVSAVRLVEAQLTNAPHAEHARGSSRNVSADSLGKVVCAGERRLGSPPNNSDSSGSAPRSGGLVSRNMTRPVSTQLCLDRAWLTIGGRRISTALSPALLATYEGLSCAPSLGASMGNARRTGPCAMLVSRVHASCFSTLACPCFCVLLAVACLRPSEFRHGKILGGAWRLCVGENSGHSASVKVCALIGFAAPFPSAPRNMARY